MLKANNPVESIASATYSALNNPEIFPSKPKMVDLDIYHFHQIWSTTALGFDHSIAGQAMTGAYTTVIIWNKTHLAVFFNGKHAYTIDEFDEDYVFEDLEHFFMKPFNQRKTYMKI